MVAGLIILNMDMCGARMKGLISARTVLMDDWVWNDDYEWMWVSDYSWGWAPFHYGRWFYDRYVWLDVGAGL